MTPKRPKIADLYFFQKTEMNQIEVDKMQSNPKAGF